MGIVKFPKVLIISHNVLSNNANNGKTIYSFFRSWPEDNLAQIFFRNEIPDFTSNISYFRILDSDILNSLFERTDFYGKEVSSISEKVSILTNVFLFQKFKFPIFYILRDFIWSCKRSKNKDLNVWLDKFSPEVVFFVGSNNTFSYDFTFEIIGKSKIPLVMFFTDDYVLPKLSIDPFWWIRLIRVKQRFLKSIEVSQKLFVIGETMAEEYSRRFGKKFCPLMNIVDQSKFELQTSTPHPNELFISYLGNLGLNRWRALADIGMEVEKLNNEGISIQFTVYSLDTPTTKVLKSINRPPYIIFAGSILEKNKIESVINTSDIVIHVESKKRKYRDITRFSVSTKISEYLSYGKCILAYGPSDVASISYLKKYDAGIICNKRKEIYENLKKIALNPALKKNYIESALKLARDKHSRPNMKEILLNAIDESYDN